mmetsp:Transcript_25693/g.58664  ORF Transcript_25693/g.58664 Transcript_25693/m.58664 type:complete len:511 (-) Transcript_25693:83-1615(-)
MALHPARRRPPQLLPPPPLRDGGARRQRVRRVLCGDDVVLASLVPRVERRRQPQRPRVQPVLRILDVQVPRVRAAHAERQLRVEVEHDARRGPRLRGRHEDWLRPHHLEEHARDVAVLEVAGAAVAAALGLEAHLVLDAVAREVRVDEARVEHRRREVQLARGHEVLRLPHGAAHQHVHLPRWRARVVVQVEHPLGRKQRGAVGQARVGLDRDLDVVAPRAVACQVTVVVLEVDVRLHGLARRDRDHASDPGRERGLLAAVAVLDGKHIARRHTGPQVQDEGPAAEQIRHGDGCRCDRPAEADGPIRVRDGHIRKSCVVVERHHQTRAVVEHNAVDLGVLVAHLHGRPHLRPSPEHRTGIISRLVLCPLLGVSEAVLPARVGLLEGHQRIGRLQKRGAKLVRTTGLKRRPPNECSPDARNRPIANRHVALCVRTHPDAAPVPVRSRRRDPHLSGSRIHPARVRFQVPDPPQIESHPLARRVVEHGPIGRRSRSILEVANVAGRSFASSGV